MTGSIMSYLQCILPLALEKAMKMMKGLPEPSIAPIYDHYFGDASSHEEKHEKK